ncbi:cytochrome P450 94A1-like [Phoenix dactylifera]|uniref:Cytochrome P450 94A1-like n=1 Tax=Phoenix dactylifera TaxID=42345 RepID=A0A8B7D558_PHODC|nr:cytochrome P450 94A1-like [Phoenix dactylifera]
MEATNLTYLTLSISILTSFILYLLLLRPPTKSRNHCPFPNPLLGNLVPFLRNRHRFLDWASDLLSTSPTATIEVRGPLGLSRGVGTANPLVVDHLLRFNFSNYVKGDRTSTALSDLLGNGIFNADGHLWALQRKTASREFTTRSLKSFITDVVRSQLRNRLLPLLSAAADTGELLDLQDVLRRFSFDNLCTIAFGTDPFSLHHDNSQHQSHGQHYSFFQAFDEAVEISSARLLSPVPWVWKAKKFFNIGSERRLRGAIKLIDDYAMHITALKEEEEVKKQDLLSRFMSAIEEEDSELCAMFKDKKEKRKFLRDTVISFVLAGKDSTSSGLTWFFWLLAVNPRCEKRVHQEISQLVEGEEEDELGYDELKGMHYLHAAITEALRLYPPVPIDSRVAAADDVLPDGTRVKAGWFADYSAYAMARNERVWGKDCCEFVPERWLDGKGEFVGVETASFPVFHAGPRTCLGREMAYMQMKAVAAAVLRRFEVEVLVGSGGGEVAPPPYEMSLTLRMKGAFTVRVRRRVETSSAR